MRFPDQLDWNTCGGAFLRVADGVLKVVDAVDDFIDSCMRVAADVDQRRQLSDLIIECGADGNAAEPVNAEIFFRR